MHTAGISEQFRVWGLGCLDPCYVLSTDADRHKWRGGEGRLGYNAVGWQRLSCLFKDQHGDVDRQYQYSVPPG
jgi:hypothetical protein